MNEDQCSEHPLNVEEMLNPRNVPITEVDVKGPKSIRDIRIRQLSYGYVINVGCQEFAIEAHERVAECIANYLKDPGEVESLWLGEHKLP